MTPVAHAGGSATRAPGAGTWAPLQGCRASAAPSWFATRWSPTPFICLALALAGCEDFPGDPQRTVTIQQPSTAQWPAELSVKDTTRLAVDIEDENGSRVTGLGVQWESDHPEVVEVRSLVPPGASGNEALLAQLRVEIVAQHRGEATVTAQVSQPGLEPSVVSQKITVMEHWTSVSAGFNHTCGVTIDHDGYCWGSGFLGTGSALGSPKPVPVRGGLKFSSVTAGDGHSCGVLLDGTVQCWGSNSNGALGNGATGDQALPVAVSLISTFVTVVAGDNYVCGVSGEFAAFCWGDNDRWELGDGKLDDALRPLPPFDDCGIGRVLLCSRTPRSVRDRNGVPFVVSSIAPGVSHTCAVSPGGAAICWGDGSVQLGSGIPVRTDSLSNVAVVEVPGGRSFDSVASGDRHTCAVGTDELAYCWGFNQRDQLGTTAPDSTCAFVDPPSVGCSRIPRVISGGLRIHALDAGGNTTCGIASDSAVYCWGSNEFGQLGDPDASGACDLGSACRAAPLRVVLNDDPVLSISVGPAHACAVTVRGALFCWGNSRDGRLGNAAATNTGIVAPTRVDEPD